MMWCGGGIVCVGGGGGGGWHSGVEGAGDHIKALNR